MIIKRILGLRIWSKEFKNDLTINKIQKQKRISLKYNKYYSCKEKKWATLRYRIQTWNRLIPRWNIGGQLIKLATSFLSWLS